MLGWQMGERLTIGDVLLLQGDLGAGKTCFSRGVIRRKLNDPNLRVTSPSYLLDNSYDYFDDNDGEGDERRCIHHMDLFRLPTGQSVGRTYTDQTDNQPPC